MTRTLLLATAAAAALIAAPVQAQTRPGTGSDAGTPWEVPHRSSGSGLPSQSPQVESLQNESLQNDSRNRALSGGSGTTGTSAGPAATQRGRTADPAWPGSQTTPSTSGSTGYSTSGAASGSVLSRDDITSRRGRGQNDLELTQTSLLNEFSAQGYMAVRDFRKNGENYVANVQDPQGRWMTVEIDPRTRAISPVR